MFAFVYKTCRYTTMVQVAAYYLIALATVYAQPPPHPTCPNTTHDPSRHRTTQPQPARLQSVPCNCNFNQQPRGNNPFAPEETASVNRSQVGYDRWSQSRIYINRSQTRQRATAPEPQRPETITASASRSQPRQRATAPEPQRPETTASASRSQPRQRATAPEPQRLETTASASRSVPVQRATAPEPQRPETTASASRSQPRQRATASETERPLDLEEPVAFTSTCAYQYQRRQSILGSPPASGQQPRPLLDRPIPDINQCSYCFKYGHWKVDCIEKREHDELNRQRQRHYERYDATQNQVEPPRPMMDNPERHPHMQGDNDYPPNMALALRQNHLYHERPSTSAVATRNQSTQTGTPTKHFTTSRKQPLPTTVCSARMLGYEVYLAPVTHRTSTSNIQHQIDARRRAESNTAASATPTDLNRMICVCQDCGNLHVHSRYQLPPDARPPMHQSDVSTAQNLHLPTTPAQHQHQPVPKTHTSRASDHQHLSSSMGTTQYR